jgi:DNA polymerase-3 subunit alpha
MTKKGSPYGIIKIEDFTGSSEIALFGNNYINYSKYGKQGMYLLIKGRIEDPYNNGRLSLSISSINLLQDVKENLIEKICITVPIHDLDKPMLNELSILIKNNPGQSMLYFKVIDGENHITQNFFSQNIRLNVSRQLIDFLQTNENIDFKING